MNKFFSLLLWYSLASSIFLGVGVLFSLETPRNLLFFLLVLPVVMYVYFSHITIASLRHGEHAEQEKYIRKAKNRMLACTLTCITLSLFFFLLLRVLMPSVEEQDTKQTSALDNLTKQVARLQETSKQTTDVTSMLKSLQKELRELRIDLLASDTSYTETPFPSASTAGATTVRLSPTGTHITTVRITSSHWQEVDVYAESSPASKVVGQARFGKTYKVVDVTDDYYYINLDNSTTPRLGWIPKQFVSEY